MKAELFTVTSVLMALTSQYVCASNQGLSGSIGAVAIYNQTQSNLATGADEVLNSLNSEGQSFTTSAIVPLGQIRYQFNQHQIFLGQSEDTFVKGLLALEVGYKNQWDKGSSLTMAFAPTLVAGEVWKNAYLLDDKREKTNINGDVFRVNYEHQYAVLDVAYYDRTIENELAQSHLLDRNGHGYFSNFALTIPFSANVFIEPNLFYQRDNAHGKANAFNKLGAGLTATFFFYPYTLAIDTRISGSQYEVEHPIFHKVREDEQFNFSLSAEEAEFLGLNQVSLVAQLTYEQSNSNLTFYNRQELAILFGGLYRF